MKTQLNSLRSKIDDLDLALLKILARRFRVVHKVAELKVKEKLPIKQAARWSQALKQREQWAKKLGLNSIYLTVNIKTILSMIHKDSIEYQKAYIKHHGKANKTSKKKAKKTRHT